MNIDCVRKIIIDKIGEYHHFVFHGSRNQKDEFDGIILEAYSSIFIIQLLNGNKRSFSYSDYVIHTIEIIP